MDSIIKYIKHRLCYEESNWWELLLSIVQCWKFCFYVLIPILIVFIATTSFIAAQNQVVIKAQLDRMEEALGTEQTNENIEARKWVWSCNWSIHDKDWDFDDGAFGESVSGCGAGNQAWKEHNWVWTRDQAYVLRNKHNEETGHTAWVGENLTLTPSQ